MSMRLCQHVPRATVSFCSLQVTLVWSSCTRNEAAVCVPAVCRLSTIGKYLLIPCKKEKKKTKPNQNKHSCAKRSFLLQVSTNQLQWSGEEGGSASPCQSPEAAWPPVACVSWGLQQGLPGRCVCSRKDGTRRWISAGCVLSQKATSACVFATWQEVLNLTLSVLPYWKLTGQTGFRQLCSVRWVASALFCFAASCNCNLLSSSSVGEKNIEMQFIPGAYWTSFRCPLRYLNMTCIN